MGKLNAIALTATAALLVLAGCGQGGAAEPVAQATQDVEPAADQATQTEVTADGTLTATDYNGTVYTINLAEPFDYSTEATDQADAILNKAFEMPEGENVTEWVALEVDNTNGTDEAYVEDLILVDDTGYQEAYPTHSAILFGDMIEEYQDSDLTTDDYNACVDAYNALLAEHDYLKPGAKMTMPVMITGIPETIEGAWIGDTELK